MVHERTQTFTQLNYTATEAKKHVCLYRAISDKLSISLSTKKHAVCLTSSIFYISNKFS